MMKKNIAIIIVSCTLSVIAIVNSRADWVDDSNTAAKHLSEAWTQCLKLNTRQRDDMTSRET